MAALGTLKMSSREIALQPGVATASAALPWPPRRGLADGLYLARHLRRRPVGLSGSLPCHTDRVEGGVGEERELHVALLRIRAAGVFPGENPPRLDPLGVEVIVKRPAVTLSGG